MKAECVRCGRTRDVEYLRVSNADGAWRCRGESTCKRRRFEARRDVAIREREGWCLCDVSNTSGPMSGGAEICLICSHWIVKPGGERR